MDTHRIYINRAQVFDEGVTWTTVPGLYPHEYFPKDYVDAQAAKIEALEAENARLREALESVLGACDQGRMIPRPGGAIGGMTIEANIRGSVYTGVPAWPIEAARAALSE